jgi:hypothetical protein
MRTNNYYNLNRVQITGYRIIFNRICSYSTPNLGLGMREWSGTSRLILPMIDLRIFTR